MVLVFPPHCGNKGEPSERAGRDVVKWISEIVHEVYGARIEGHRVDTRIHEACFDNLPRKHAECPFERDRRKSGEVSNSIFKTLHISRHVEGAH